MRKIVKATRLFIVLAISLAAFTSANATTAYTTSSGNWNAGATWSIQPSQWGSQGVTNLVVRHAVNFNQNYTLSSNMVLTITTAGSLSGTNTLTVNNGTVSVRGTLSVTNLTLSGTSATQHARLSNSGTVTVSGNVSWGANSIVHNYGTMTLQGTTGHTFQGDTLFNYAGATFTVEGNTVFSTTATVFHNYGTANFNGASADKALDIQEGAIYNYKGGILNVPNGGLFVATASTTEGINYGKIALNRLEVGGSSRVVNYDTITVSGNAVNASSNMENAVSGYINITGNLTNSGTIANDGSLIVGGNLTNSGTINSTDGGIAVTGTTSNTGTINGGTSYTAPSFTVGSLSGTTPTCASTTGLTYSIPAVSGATSYTWTAPSGWSITAGSATNTITASASSSAGVGTFIVKIETNSGWGASAFPVAVSGSTPSAPGTIAGPTAGACGDNGFTFSVPYVASVTSWEWEVPAGWTIQAGQGTNILTTTVGLSGNVRVRAINGCGTSGWTSLSFTSSGTPSTPVFTTTTGHNPTTVCENSVYNYSVTTTAGLSYNWTVPTGWTIQSGQGTAAIQVLAGSSNGNVTVTSQSSANCVSSAAILSVSTVVPLANAGPAQNVCGNDPVGLAGNDPTSFTGVWTVVSSVGSPTFADSNAYNTTVSNLGFGPNVLRWTISGNGCNSSSEVVVVRNCPAVFTFPEGSPLDIENTALAMVIMLPVDADGDIDSAGLVSGSIPSGCLLNATTGAIYIDNLMQLQPGTYNFSLETRDIEGGISTTSGSFTFIGDPLPVTLTSFTAQQVRDYVAINWTTSSEIDNSHFEVERSDDGRRFYTIGRVEGNHTTQLVRRYNFVDRAPLHGNTYYRLRQVDFNGKFEYSDVVLVRTRAELQPEGAIAVYPNPATAAEGFQLALPASREDYHVCIMDMGGRRVNTQTFGSADAGRTEWMQTGSLKPGIYVIQVTTAGVQFSEKLNIR